MFLEGTNIYAILTQYSILITTQKNTLKGIWLSTWYIGTYQDTYARTYIHTYARGICRNDRFKRSLQYVLLHFCIGLINI